MSNRGHLFVISAPSGSGKTSLTRGILKRMPKLRFSVSHTTREPRRGEQHGREYFFVSEAEFETLIEKDAFLEYAHVYGNYYGTTRAFVDRHLDEGQDVLLDVDVQGAVKAKAKKEGAILIFVFPPSLRELEARLRGRGLDDEAIISHRLGIARDEIRSYRQYDYLIINRCIEDSLEELQAIVLASRLPPGDRTPDELKWMEMAARCRREERIREAEAIIETFLESNP